MPLIPPPAKIPLPIQEDLRDFFVAAYSGKGAAADRVKDQLKVKNRSDSPTILVTVWEDRHRRVAALCIAELRMAASLGAALLLLPGVVVQEVEAANSLDGDAREAYDEVMNMLLGRLNQSSPVHLKLVGTFEHPQETLPDDAWVVLESPSARRDFALQIDGYGEGRLAILTR